MINFTINKPEVDKTYVQRNGAYAIIINDKNLLAIIKTPLGYFLPGGGIEASESEQECIIRECLEEAGLKIKVLEKISIGNFYFFATTTNKYTESIGHFYSCEIIEQLENKTEEDHELIWLETHEAMRLLYLDNQRQAVKLFLETSPLAKF